MRWVDRQKPVGKGRLEVEGLLERTVRLVGILLMGCGKRAWACGWSSTILCMNCGKRRSNGGEPVGRRAGSGGEAVEKSPP